MSFENNIYKRAEALARPTKITTYATRKEAEAHARAILDVLISAITFPPRASVLPSDISGYQIHFYGFDRSEHATMMASAGHHCSM